MSEMSFWGMMMVWLGRVSVENVVHTRKGLFSLWQSMILIFSTTHNNPLYHVKENNQRTPNLPWKCYSRHSLRLQHSITCQEPLTKQISLVNSVSATTLPLFSQSLTRARSDSTHHRNKDTPCSICRIMLRRCQDWGWLHHTPLDRNTNNDRGPAVILARQQHTAGFCPSPDNLHIGV